MTEEQFIEFIQYFKEHDGKYAFCVADLSEEGKIKDLYCIPSDKISYTILSDKHRNLGIILDKSVLRHCLAHKKLSSLVSNAKRYYKLIKKGKDVLGDVEYIKQLENGFDKFIDAWNAFIHTLEDETK